eukprot:scaffold39074_cov123-Skeletonema_marinoi.AAC.5
MDPSLNNSGEAEAAPARPQRPFTEYNVFFQLERESLLQSQEDGLNNGAYTVKRILAQERQVESPEKVALRPPQYRHLILPSDWYVVGSKYTGKGDPNSYRRDRKHRKTHGVISFVELTKLVSSKWKVVDPQTKDYCRNIAQEEFKRYRKELDEFIKIYGADAAKGKKRKPRKSKATAKQVVEPKKPEEPQQMAEAEPFDGECAFIPIDDDLADDIIGINHVHSSEKVDMLSKVAETDFEKNLGDGMCADFSFYAPNRLSRQGDINLADKSTIQDQAHSAMYPANQRVSLNDVMGRSLSLPFTATNGYSDNLGMMTTPAVSNIPTFHQGRAVDRSFSMPAGYGNDHAYVHGNNFGNQGVPQAFGPNYRFGESGPNQGPVTGVDLDQFDRQYYHDISRDMTQQRSLELQRQLLPQQHQTGEIQNCVEQSYLSQFHKECVINNRRVSMESVGRSSMDIGRGRRSSMDTAFSQSSMSTMKNAGYRRSSLPTKPKMVQASKEFPQLTLQQEQIIKSLAEQEKLRKSLQSPGDSTFGKLPIADKPTTNYPSAA